MEAMSLYDVLGRGQIVGFCKEWGWIVTWNSGTTFNLYTVEGDKFYETDAWQTTEKPNRVESAMMEAGRKLKEIRSELDQSE